MDGRPTGKHQREIVADAAMQTALGSDLVLTIAAVPRSDLNDRLAIGCFRFAVALWMSLIGISGKGPHLAAKGPPNIQA